MEIACHLSRRDVEPYYEWLFSREKRDSRQAHYANWIWSMLPLLIGAGIAFRHSELFAGCLLTVFVIYSTMYSWRYEKIWQEQSWRATAQHPEGAVTFRVTEEGLEEAWDGIRNIAAWKAMKGYTLAGGEERKLLIIPANTGAFTVPFRVLSAAEQEELVQILRNHGLSELPAA